jgi:hypothetical protein
MTSEWPTYRTKNGDELDERFFNNRLRSIDNRLSAIELNLGTIEEGSSSLVADAIAAVQSASSVALVAFNNSLAETLSVVQDAQANIEALEDEVTALLGTLGDEFQVDCEAGSKVKIRRSATPDVVPIFSSLDWGELYVNYADKKLFFRGLDDSVVEIKSLPTAAQILALLIGVDGQSSGLDADLLDGQHASAFAAASHTHSGFLTAAGGTIAGALEIQTDSVNPSLKLRQVGSGDLINGDDEAGDLTPFRVTNDSTVHCKNVILESPATLLAHLGAAPTANPTFTGTASAPTPAADDNTTKIATTAYVQGELTDRVITARTVTGTGLAGGGGDLSANRTIDVPKSSQGQAEAGTDDTTAMTPVRTKDAINALAPLLTNLEWKGASFTVSTLAPSGGADGDFWFERVT